MPQPETFTREAPSRRGFFLALDGPDGGGKTTQAAELARWLRDQGREVVSCRDPGGTSLGDRLRAILLDRGYGSGGYGEGRYGGGLRTRPEMLLYMASRAQLVEEVIRPALDAGKVVVSDRFLLSNIVYQGDAGGLGVDEVARVGLVATDDLLPDLTLVLDVPVALARSRIGGSRDRLEDRPDSYHTKVREGYLRAVELAQQGGCPYYRAPLALVDATADAQTVAALIRNEVARALALDPRG